MISLFRPGIEPSTDLGTSGSRSLSSSDQSTLNLSSTYSYSFSFFLTLTDFSPLPWALRSLSHDVPLIVRFSLAFTPTFPLPRTDSSPPLPLLFHFTPALRDMCLRLSPSPIRAHPRRRVRPQATRGDLLHSCHPGWCDPGGTVMHGGIYVS